MNAKSWMVAVLAALGMCVICARPQEAPNTRDVMQYKLHYAQRILEGITTENFALISTNAHRLNRLSYAVSWQLRHTTEYQSLTKDFQTHAEQLENAAEKRNVDAATVAYFQLTVSCVNCHRYLRQTRQAGLPQ